MSSEPSPGFAYRATVILLLAIMAVSLAAIAVKVVWTPSEPQSIYSKR